MRCFIALPLPAEAREALVGVLSPIKSTWPRSRWVSTEGYHLTLAFLGEIEEPALGCAKRALDAVAGAGSFAFRFHGFGFLPPRGAPRVFVADLDEKPEHSSARMYRLVNEALDAEARRAGVPPLNREWAEVMPQAADAGKTAEAGTVPVSAEPRRGGGRPFRPHITLARLNPGAPGPNRQSLASAAAGGAILGGPWTLGRCVLYKSDLRRGGAVYTEIAGVALG